MTSVNIRFRASGKEGAESGHIVFRIIHQRQIRKIASTHQIHSKEWDKLKQKNRDE